MTSQPNVSSADPVSRWSRVWRFFSSYGLACALLLVMLVLTYLGTLYQVEHGLHAARKRYFESFFLVHWLLGLFPLPLPGGFMVIGLFFVNLVCGGVIRARKGWRHTGVLVAHSGVVLLLAGSFVTYAASTRGHIRLYEGETTDRFSSNTQWELLIHTPQNGQDDPLRVPMPPESFPVTIDVADDIRLGLTRYYPNCRPTDESTADQIVLSPLPLVGDPETHAPGALFEVVSSRAEPADEIVLYGYGGPVVFPSPEGEVRVNLQRRSRRLPFEVELKAFAAHFHPGTSKPSAFVSEVTVADRAGRREAVITMNQPLRLGGYTLYQSSWGPSDALPEETLYSVFAVVRNPAEDVPLWASVVVVAGLLLHCLVKMGAYVRRLHGR